MGLDHSTGRQQAFAELAAQNEETVGKEPVRSRRPQLCPPSIWAVAGLRVLRWFFLQVAPQPIQNATFLIGWISDTFRVLNISVSLWRNYFPQVEKCVLGVCLGGWGMKQKYRGSLFFLSKLRRDDFILSARCETNHSAPFLETSAARNSQKYSRKGLLGLLMFSSKWSDLSLVQQKQPHQPILSKVYLIPSLRAIALAWAVQ